MYEPVCTLHRASRLRRKRDETNEKETGTVGERQDDPYLSTSPSRRYRSLHNRGRLCSTVRECKQFAIQLSPSHLLKYFLYFRLQDPNTARLSPLLVVSGSRPRQATAKSPGPQPRSLRVVSLPRKRLQCSLPHARLLLPHARLLLPYPPSYRLGLWTSQEGEDALVLTVCRLPCALANCRNPSPVIVR